MITSWTQGFDIPKESRFGAVAVADLEFSMVCQGLMQFISVIDTTASPVEYHFKTGAYPVRIKFNLQAGLKVGATIKEDAVVTNNGTSVNIRNYNRLYSDNGLAFKVYKTPTYTGGTIYRYNQAGFGTNPGQAATGAATGASGYVFKPNTSYVLTMTPSAETDMVLIADFWEVTS